jgi:hypothetical protein
MTVGEPEINLNSWGIRYVKVKQSPTAELDKEPKEGDKREVSTGGLSDLDASTSTFPDRQEDSKGDKDSHIRTADQTEKEKELNRGGSPQSVTSVNTPLKEVDGQLQTFNKPKYGVGSVATGSTQGGKGTKTLTTGQHGTQTGKKGVPKFDAPKQSEVSGHVGSNVGYDSGIKSPDADKKRVSGKGKPTVFKKPKEGEGGTAASGEKFDEAHAKRMRKAIMDMNIAILKCNSFKMKRIAYSSGGDSKYGDENTHDARIDDDPESKDNQAVQSKTETLAPDREDETEVSSYGSGATGQHGKEGDKKLNSEGEIVRKAIELINEAYDQIGKDDIRGRHDDRSDDETPEPKFTWGCPESGCDFKTGDEDKVGSHVNSHDKDSKTNKADSAVTTGTEGTNNPVMAGEKEPFGKTLDTKGRKDEYTPEEHAEHNSQKD